MAKVLLVDDEITMVQMVTELLRSEGHEVHPFTNGAKAMDALESIQPELVITDLYLDKSQNTFGLEIVTKARSLNPPAIVIVVTGFGSIETAVEAMKKGAYDYLEKPFKLDQLKLCLQRALSYNDAISENVYLRRQLKKKYQFNQIIGASTKMHNVFKLVERIADTDSTALILGESGTGKELIAKAIHFNSRRQFAPFVPVNCSALPESLLESELFGHRKGSFTGAIQDKKGLFQEADGGSIFLDEIGTMSPTLQSRLLRVLQEKEVRAVGDNTPTYVNVRVIAATNEPLEERVEDGSFREDLYYRLNVIAIHLPSLRQRKDDIPLLIAHFLNMRGEAYGGVKFRITRRAMSSLIDHNWPGNVRELENAIERCCALCFNNVIQWEDLPPAIRKRGPGIEGDTAIMADQNAISNSSKELKEEDFYPLNFGNLASNSRSDLPDSQKEVSSKMPSIGQSDLTPNANLKAFLKEQENQFIIRTLAQFGGDKEKAAQKLGVSLATLYRKLAEEE